MATNPIGSRHGGREGGGKGCDRLVALPARRAPVAPGGTAKSLQDGPRGQLYRIGLQFTPADHAAMAAWVEDASHGYDRLDVEPGLLEDGSWASYALVYVPGQAWSTWGVSRQGGHLEVWRCATGKMVGRHARMAAALAALPHAADHRRVSQVMTAGIRIDRPHSRTI